METKCSVCGNEMMGRADRKFCSAACRQKSYRQSRNETDSRNVTAKPFLTNDDPTPYKGREDFWAAIADLPELLGDLSMFDADADPQQYGYEPGIRPTVPIYPARRKSSDLAARDVAHAVDQMRDFKARYDEMVTNLARARATVDLIAEHHGYEL